MEPSETKVIRRLYIGKRLSNAGKLLYVWTDTSDIERIALYKKNLVSCAGIGQIYEFHQDGDASIIVGGAKAPVFIERWSDEDAITRFAAIERADVARYTMDRRAKRDAEENEPIERALRPIRKAMAETNADGRAAIVAFVVRELYRPRSLGE